MAYNPSSRDAAIHGMDIVVVSSDERLAAITAERSGKEPLLDSSSTTVFVTVPPFADLGSEHGNWGDAVIEALESCGFEKLWDCSLDVRQKDIDHPVRSDLLRLTIPESSAIALPQLVEKMREAFEPLFGERGRASFELWCDQLDDRLDEAQVRKLDKRAFRDGNMKVLSQSLSESLKILMMPCLIPYLKPAGTKDPDGKDRSEWARLASDEDRRTLLATLGDAGLINGSFFTSSAPAWSDTVKLSTRNGRLSALVPYTFWRAGGAAIDSVRGSVSDIEGAKVSLRFGKENAAARYDPMGSRSMYTLYVDFDGLAPKMMDLIAKRLESFFMTTPEANARGLEVPDRGKPIEIRGDAFTRFVPTEYPQGDYVKPGDEENSNRKISPCVYLHVDAREGRDLAVLHGQLADWSERNGVVLRGQPPSKNGNYMGLYFSMSGTDAPKMNSLAGRMDLAKSIADACASFGPDAVSVRMEPPVVRLKTFTSVDRSGAVRAAVKLPFSGSEPGDAERSKPEAFLDAFAASLKEKGWSDESGMLRRERMYILPLGGRETPEQELAAGKQGASNAVKEALAVASQASDGFKPIVEQRSPRDERLYSCMVQVQENITDWKRSNSSAPEPAVTVSLEKFPEDDPDLILDDEDLVNALSL